jgi:hypothetical protein
MRFMNKVNISAMSLDNVLMQYVIQTFIRLIAYFGTLCGVVS